MAQAEQGSHIMIRTPEIVAARGERYVSLDELPIKLAFADFETDPFKRSVADPENKALNMLDPKPFCVGVMHADGAYWDHWGDDSAEAFVRYIETITEPTIFYFHNGGRFDFVFIQKFMKSQKPPMMIKNVLVAGTFGIHQVRDSYALVPSSLRSAVGKTAIEYEKMERETRAEYKAEIMRYLRSDCDNLRILITKFLEFVINAAPAPTPDPHKKARKITKRLPGEKSKPFSCVRYTASSYAFAIMRAEPMGNGKLLDIPTRAGGYMLRLFAKIDALFRPYYMGGRVQMFKQGVIKTAPREGYKKYDITSSYPNAMANFDHPVYNVWDEHGPGEFELDSEFWVKGYPEQLFFIEFEGETLGVPGKCVPGMNSLAYSRGRFKMMSHEFRTGCELGYVVCEKPLNAYVFPKSSCTNFKPFVDKYFGERKKMKARIKALNKRLSSELETLAGLGFDAANDLIDPLTRSENAVIADCATRLIKIGYEIAEATALAETYKLLLNGSYGKFGFDFKNYPAKVWQNYLLGVLTDLDGFTTGESQEVYDPETHQQFGDVLVGDETTCRESYVSIMTAASITSAARSVLMRAVHAADDVLYVDTDSMLVKSAGPETPIEKGDSVLGYWKLEKDDVFEIAIAGPKLYALHYLDEKSTESHPVTVDGETRRAVWEVRAKGAKTTNKVPAVNPDGSVTQCKDKLMGAGDFADILEIAANPDGSFLALQIAPSMRVGKANRFADRQIRRVGQAIPAGNIAAFKARGIAPQLSTLEVWENVQMRKAVAKAHAENADIDDGDEIDTLFPSLNVK